MGSRRIPAGGLPALGLLVPLLLLATPAPARAQPSWWLGLGVQMNVDVDGLNDLRGTEAGAFLVGGVHVWRAGAVLVGIEGEGSASRVKDSVDAEDDTVDVWRGRAGLRLTWWEEYDAPLVVPYLRGGAVYRADRLSLSDDEGVGWYAGGGVDLMLSERWGLGMFATYERTSLRGQTTSLLVGIGLSFHY